MAGNFDFALFKNLRPFNRVKNFEVHIHLVFFSLAVETLMNTGPRTLPQKGALRVYRLASAPLLRRARTLTRRGSGQRVQR